MKTKSLKVNAMLNTIRQSITVVFPLISYAYVLRVLGTEEYGRYTFSASIVSYFQLFATFGISTFAIRESTLIRDDRKSVSKLASDLFSFNIITCTIAYFALALLAIFSPKVNSYTELIFIQSMCMLLSLIGMDWVNNVYEDFLYITIRYIIIQVLALISIFLFVKSSADTAIYCLILVLGSYGGNLLNLLYIRRYIDLPRPHRFQIKKYLTPLSILFVNSLATTIYVNSDVTMIGFFLDDTQVGLYGFASKVYNVIKYLINAAIIVTIPRLTALVNKDKDKYKRLTETVLYALVLFLLPASTGLFMLSKPIVICAGGPKYYESYSSLMILSFSLVFALLGSICTNCILIIHKLERRVLTATIISALINVFLNLMLIPYIGIIGAAITTVIAELTNLGIQFYFCKKEARFAATIYWKDIVSTFVGVIEVVIVCIIAMKIWSPDNLIDCIKQIVFSVVIAGILYFITLLLTKNRLVYSLLLRKK